MSSVDLGSLKPGQTIQKTLTLKNTGDAFISEILAYEVIEINQNGWNTSSESRGSLGIGETLHLFVEVRAATDAQPGDYSGEIKIVCKD